MLTSVGTVCMYVATEWSTCVSALLLYSVAVLCIIVFDHSNNLRQELYGLYEQRPRNPHFAVWTYVIWCDMALRIRCHGLLSYMCTYMYVCRKDEKKEGLWMEIPRTLL